MKLKTLITLLSLLVSTTMFADNERLRQNFDFDWKFSLSDDSLYKNPAFVDKDWQDVQLPHDWNISQNFVREQGGAVAYLPEGIAWYRKSFVMPSSSSNKNVMIMFDGIFMQSDVYINGHHLGFRPYGFCSIEYDLTPYLNAPGKENVIAVRVNTTGGRPRWYSGAGIYRHVWLNTVNPVHVKTYGTYVTTPEITDSKATVNCSASVINNSDKSQKISVFYSILNAEGKVVAKCDGGQILVEKDSVAEFTKSVSLKSPKLWDVDSPYLYSLETVVKDQNKVIDRVVTPFGVRSFNFDPDHGFSLNGKQMKLKGMCLHQDAGSMGVAVPDRSYERRLEILKEYGCNAIRCAHNQPSPEFLDMCDRLGFLVIDEAFDKWKSGYYEKYFDDWWQADMTDMVMRDRNHPSVILWSIGNELQEAWDGANTGKKRASMLQKFVHNLEPTRPCTLAAQNNHQAKFSGVTDVIGYNYLEARMISDHQTYPKRCFLISEELPYYSGEEGNIRSYTNYNPWNYVENNEFIAGGFIWSGVDYLGESGWPSKGWPNGLFDICMFEKPRAAYHRSKWNDKPLVSIAVIDPSLNIDHGRDLWQWPNMASHWNFPDSYYGLVMEVRTVTNCEQVEMFFEGKSMGKQFTKDFANNTIIWNIPFRQGKLEAKGYNNGIEVANYVLVTAGKPTDLKITVDRDNINSDGQDLSHIALQLVDKDGNPVQTDDKEFSVVVEGEGRLKGLDNGDLRVNESFAKNALSTYFGKALITVQSTRTSGNINVKVTMDGLNKTYNIPITTK
jgi:beta-galactosidase